MKLLNALIIFVLIVTIPAAAMLGSWLNDRDEMPIFDIRELANEHLPVLILCLAFAALAALFFASKMDEDK